MRLQATSSVTNNETDSVVIKQEPVDQDLNDYIAAMEKQAVERMMGERKGEVSLICIHLR